MWFWMHVEEIYDNHVINSVQFSRVQLCDPMGCSTPGFPVHHQLQNLLKLMSIKLVMPSNHLILVIPFSSCLQSFPASGSFPMSQFFASDGQRIRVLASASVLLMNIQDLFPLVEMGLISNGLSRVFSNTTVWTHQFFSAYLSLWSNCHIHTWLLEKS